MNYRIKDIPIGERPRERLLEVGVNNLSMKELLAIILKTGTKEKSVNLVALDLLNKYKATDFKDLSISELTSITGIGKVKAIELMAAIELGKRIYLTPTKSGEKLMCAKDIFLTTRYLFSGLKQEYFYALYLNNKNELIERKLLFMGTVNRSLTHPREVFKEAYKLSASGIICLHNHPTNDITPSREDISFTKTLVETGNIQGLPVLDHIIVGENTYYSFYEHHNILNH